MNLYLFSPISFSPALSPPKGHIYIPVSAIASVTLFLPVHTTKAPERSRSYIANRLYKLSRLEECGGCPYGPKAEVRATEMDERIRHWNASTPSDRRQVERNLPLSTKCLICHSIVIGCSLASWKENFSLPRATSGRHGIPYCRKTTCASERFTMRPCITGYSRWSLNTCVLL